MPLSIVIPTHQRTDLLAACLQSIFCHRAETEVIVVDDASPESAASELVRPFTGVRVIRLEERGGFCAAANAGMRAAEAPIVQLLNDDTEVTAGWAEAALAVFRRLPEVAAIAPLVLRWPDGECIDSAGDRYYLGGVAGKRGMGLETRFLQETGFLEPRYVFGAGGCGAFYRRDALLAVGGFPEEFGAYFDDIDLSFRLRHAGYQIWYEPASRILHHGSASYGPPCGELLRQQSRNEERVFWRNVPDAKMATAIPKHLAVLAAKALRRWRKGELLPFLQGRWDAAKDMPAILRHRRHMRRHARARSDLLLAESWWEDEMRANR